MPPIRIRHLMIVVVYVAVTIALCMPAIESLRMPAMRGGLFDGVLPLAVASVEVPLAWAGIAWFVSRAGPVRDWFTMLFLCLALILTIYWSLVFYFSRNTPNWPIGLLVALPAEIYVVWMITEHLIPQPCPECQKKGLIRALRFTVRSEAELYAFTRCGRCSFEGWAIRKRSLPPCPSCRSDALETVGATRCGSAPPPGPYQFTHYWCLNCGSRWKRTGPEEPFRPAGPDDDRQYSSWSLGRRQQARIERDGRVRSLEKAVEAEPEETSPESSSRGPGDRIPSRAGGSG